MRQFVAVTGFSLMSLLSAFCYGQSAPEADKSTNAAKPRVHALIAAVGEQFTLIQQKPSVGSHLPPFRPQIIG